MFEFSLYVYETSPIDRRVGLVQVAKCNYVFEQVQMDMTRRLFLLL